MCVNVDLCNKDRKRERERYKEKEFGETGKHDRVKTITALLYVEFSILKRFTRKAFRAGKVTSNAASTSETPSSSKKEKNKFFCLNFILQPMCESSFYYKLISPTFYKTTQILHVLLTCINMTF